jgi:hypothetical protein
MVFFNLKLKEEIIIDIRKQQNLKKKRRLELEVKIKVTKEHQIIKTHIFNHFFLFF